MTENYKCRNGHIFTKVGSIAECPKCNTRLCNPIKEVRAPITTLPSSHKIKRISKTYITSFSSFFWISFTLSLLGWMFLFRLYIIWVAIFCFSLAGLLGVVVAIMWFKILYIAWDSIQSLREEDPSESGMPTPGKAVGFCFIPFFNFYWIFVALAGLAKRMNKFVKNRDIEHDVISTTLAVIVSVLLIIGFTPFIGGVTYLLALILFYIFFRQVVHAINIISEM